MPTYYMNEAAFDLLDVGYADRTVNLLDVPGAGGGNVSIVIQRYPLAVGASLREAVNGHIRASALSYRAHNVLKEREGQAGGAPMIEVVSRHRSDEGMVIAREAHVVAGDRRLLISATTTFDQQASSEEHLNKVLATLRLRE